MRQSDVMSRVGRVSTAPSAEKSEFVERQVLKISHLLDTLEELNQECSQLENKFVNLPEEPIPQVQAVPDFESWKKRIELAEKALEREEETLGLLRKFGPPPITIEHTELDVQLSLLEQKHSILQDKHQQLSKTLKSKTAELKEYSKGNKPKKEARESFGRHIVYETKDQHMQSLAKGINSSLDVQRKQMEMQVYEKELHRLQSKKQLLQEKNKSLRQKAAVAVDRFSKLQELLEENKSLARQLQTLRVANGITPKYEDWEAATEAEVEALKRVFKKSLLINDSLFLKEAQLFS